mmetsp:Transcript_83361/g.236251  ORF Transcript_83361/g.236251 Transcript_83361/m.236251 type:complete len:411 (+) Transcript_83361:90-1322(+)
MDPSRAAGAGASGAAGNGAAGAPVQLPLAAGGAGPGTTLGPDSQDGSDVLGDPELDEEDLFGSGDEGVPGADGAAPGPAQPAPPERAPDEEDLFGDVEDEVDEKELFGSDDEGPEIDEKELFGSDDDLAEGAPAAAAARTEAEAQVAPSEPSELDEREIFGDVSDDEPEKVEDVILRRRPAPSDDRTFMSLRLPNVLSVEKSAFRPDAIPQSAVEGYKEFKNTRNMHVVKLLNPENCIRWRFKKGPDGQNLTDEDGRPQYESNSRIVEWEDGTRTLFVGNETFNVSEIDDKVVLFEENSQDIHVCHGVSRKRLVATPRNLKSASHEALKRSQFRKYEPLRRSLLLSQEDQAESKQLYELEMEQKKRQEQKQKRVAEAGRAEITAAFLEDEPDAGPSVLDVKRQFKRPRQG